MQKALCALALMLAFPCLAAQRDWETVTNCTLVANASNDGDSFHARVGNREVVLRLYFVDCPETDLRFPDRVGAQAAYFSATTNAALAAGKAAAAFTARQLAKPFTILTRWQDALGDSKLGREYAAVTTADGRDLAEALVSAGLARIHGVNVGGIGAERVARLQKLEQDARKAKAGAWAMAKH